MNSDSLTNAQARQVALAAQGMGCRGSSTEPEIEHIRQVLSRTRLLQIDSVYVLERAHYMPVYSRVGPYSRDLLNDAAYRAPRELFEYWGHAASLVPVELYPYLRWRMNLPVDQGGAALKRIEAQRPGFIDDVYTAVVERGPISARQLDETPPRSKTHWGWNWSDTKLALEWLFRVGRVGVASRPSFERHYDIIERVIPEQFLNAAEISRPDAHRELVAQSARALGVATISELSDYFRLSVRETRTAVAELVEDDVLRPVSVDGWDRPAYLHREATLPENINACTLISPFDPLIWHRDRTQRLWDFYYRIEIYVPEAKRVHGYYVLPFLLGDELVSRVDMKADRRAKILHVPASWYEENPQYNRDDVAVALARELGTLAYWLGLDTIKVGPAGDLSGALDAAVRAVSTH